MTVIITGAVAQCKYWGYLQSSDLLRLLLPRLPVTHIREFAVAVEIRPLVGLAAAIEGGEVKYALPYSKRRLIRCSYRLPELKYVLNFSHV